VNSEARSRKLETVAVRVLTLTVGVIVDDPEGTATAQVAVVRAKYAVSPTAILGSLELLGSQPDTRRFRSCPNEGIPVPIFSMVNCNGLAAFTGAERRRMPKSSVSTPSGVDSRARRYDCFILPRF
jgi:hypothetical protein